MSAVAALNRPAVLHQIRARRASSRPGLLNSAALLTLGAAVTHFAVAPEHLAEYAPYGIFFIGLGLAQTGLAMTVLVAPERRLFAAGAVGNALVIGLWLLSRTTGLPIAPVPWRPEPVGLVDLYTTLLEAIAWTQFVRLLRGSRPVDGRGWMRRAVAASPTLLAVGLAIVLGAGVAANPMLGAVSAAPAIPGQASTSLINLMTPIGSEPVRSFELTAGVTSAAGHSAWAFNGTVPGPELRVKQGERVRATLVNHLPEATSIHWHGLRLPNVADGVSGVTQDAVRPGASYVYEFLATDPGTYWYHAHQNTSEQLPRGLLGALVVLPAAGTAEQRDYSLTLQSQPGGDAVLVNGTSNLHLDAAPGETVRLRLINAALPGFDGAPQTPVLVGARYRVVALDGHDLNQPEELGPERIPLGMGQRADVVFTMPPSGSVRLAGVVGPAPFLPFLGRSTPVSVTVGTGPPPPTGNLASLPRFDLTRYGQRAADPVADARAYDLDRQIVLAGGPGFRNGGFDFTDTFNGKTSPLITPIGVREGDLVRLHVVNSSQKAHPIHIHGHVFSVLAKNGHRLTGSPVQLDAILVGPKENWDVAFKADNPGIWMLHCHVLAHAAAGMSMSVNYAGISTPFTMGRRSGNMPE